MKVLTPHFEGDEVEQLTFATRRHFEPGDQLHLLLVENGKPKARQLLQFVADEIRQRLPIVTVEVHSKPSAGRPIDADLVTMFAARAHLVISGLGD
jgi:hypothetical protein